MGTPLPKNGHDNAQDRAIKVLTDEFRSHIADEEHHHGHVEESVMALAASIDKYIFAGRIAWAFLGIIGMIVGSYQVSISNDLHSLEGRMDAIESKQAAFEERGTKWGEQLDSAVQEIRQDIREIRRAVNGRMKE